MPIDLTPLGDLVPQEKPVPALGYKPIPYVNEVNLNTFLKKEIPQKFADKATVKFVDCQSVKEHETKQFAGVLHMNFDNVVNWAASRFRDLIQSVPAAYEGLGKADVVVFYCQYGANRSPAIAGLYLNATADADTRPNGYNEGQRVMVINGGMKGYMGTPSPQGLKDWLAPTSGKIVAGGKGGVKPVQPGGDEDEIWEVIYTDP